MAIYSELTLPRAERFLRTKGHLLLLYLHHQGQQQQTQINGSTRSSATQRATPAVPGHPPKQQLRSPQSTSQVNQSQTTITASYSTNTLDKYGRRKESTSSYESLRTSDESLTSPNTHRRQMPKEDLRALAMQQYGQRQRYLSSSSSYGIQNGYQSSDEALLGQTTDQWSRPAVTDSK